MLDEETYQKYYRSSYFYALAFNQDVEKFLEYSYDNEIITEEVLLEDFYPFIDTNKDNIPCTSIVLNNLYKVLSSVSSKHINKINDTKLLINNFKAKSDVFNNFLIAQYIARNYGVNGFDGLNLYELYKFNKVDMSFFYKFKEQIYSSLVFDFQLIHSLSKEPMIDACKNNYQFLGSLNYFKCFYPLMLQDDCFLEFSKDILEHQAANKFNVICGNCLISNCANQNKKLLKYVKKNLKNLKNDIN